jgi:PDDEXK-like domain of unknown function (DUF3799)
LADVVIDTPGIYDIPMAEYLADPVAAGPSLSASTIHTLLAQSPRHAWTAHPRLNPAYQAEEREAFDLGTAAHAFLLEGDDAFTLLPYPDYRTRAARDQRDEARRAGKVPLLENRWADVVAMATQAWRQIGLHPRPRPLSDGRPERTLVWQEGRIWCRARLDWLRLDTKGFDDYKTTSGSAHPDVWIRGSLFANGYDIQAVWYQRGIQAVFGHLAEPRFVVQETFLPHALSVIGLGPDVLTLATKKVLAALEIWEECLTTDTWPAYPARTCHATLPPWEEARWLEREEREIAEHERRRD